MLTRLLSLVILLGPSFVSTTHFFEQGYGSPKRQNFFATEHEKRQNITIDEEVEQILRETNLEIIDDINLRFSPGRNTKLL
jgi:hypothetical protein